MKSEPHVTVLDLDLVVLGQASPEHLARIETHSVSCTACAARRAEHGEHVRNFRSTVFPRTVESLALRRRPVVRWPWMFGLALPLAACLLMLVRSHPSGKNSVPAFDPPRDPGPIGIKGSPVVRVFARRNRPNADVIKVNDGDRLADGDALRFVLPPTGLPYVLIASVDGAGQASVYYPFHGEASVEVDPKVTVSVPGSIVLDKAPGPERIFVIYSEKPIQAETVREELAKLGAGGAGVIRGAQHLPIAETVQASLWFEKNEP